MPRSRTTTTLKGDAMILAICAESLPYKGVSVMTDTDGQESETPSERPIREDVHYRLEDVPEEHNEEYRGRAFRMQVISDEELLTSDMAVLFVLSTLANAEGEVELKYADIAAYSKLSPSTLTGVFKRLQAGGWVEVERVQYGSRYRLKRKGADMY